MELNSLKTARHIEEVIEHPNPLALEATKVFFSNQRLNMAAFGSDFLKIYLEIEGQMYAYLERAKREEERNIPDTIMEDTIERASEGPKFNIR